jgi:tight adherence protein B
MVIAVAVTFVVVLMTLVGPYWFFVLRPEGATQRLLFRRLKVRRQQSAVRLGLLKTAQRLSAIGPVHDALLRKRTLLQPVERLIDQAGASITVATLLLSCGVAGLVTLGVVTLVTGYFLFALPLAIVATAAPVGVLKWRRSRRLLSFEEQFPEALDLLSRALKAGHGFTTGLSMVSDELPAPVGPEFRTLYDQQNFGMPLPDALKAFAGRVPLLDAKFFATAVLTQRESGGNLSEVLENLASVIRDRFKVKRQIRVISAHGKLTGVVLTAVPPVLGFVLFVISPEHWRVLLNDSLGIRLVLAAILLQVTGGLIIRKMVRIEY